MSAIGPSSFAALNLAGSFAAAGRSPAETDRFKAEVLERALQVDRQEYASAAGEDIVEPDFASERDADGRMPYAPDRRNAGDDDQDGPSLLQTTKPPDAYGLRGHKLDLEA